jgi:hypothetical protein
LIKLAAFGKTSITISFHAGKTPMIIVCLARIACLILETISAGDRALIFGDRSKYRNQDSSAVVIPLKLFTSGSYQIRNTPFDASTRRASGPRLENGVPVTREFFHPQLFWRMSFMVATVARK